MRLKVRHIAPILCFQIADIIRNILFTFASSSNNIPFAAFSLFISEACINLFFAALILVAIFRRSTTKTQIIYLFNSFHIIIIAFSIAFFFIDKLSQSFRGADALRQLIAFCCLKKVILKLSSRNTLLFHQILHDSLIFVQLATTWSIYTSSYQENPSLIPLDKDSLDDYNGVTSSLFGIVYIISFLLNRESKPKAIKHKQAMSHAEDSIKQQQPQNEQKKQDNQSLSKDNFDIYSANQFLPLSYNNSPSMAECPPIQLDSNHKGQMNYKDSQKSTKTPKILLFTSPNKKKRTTSSSSAMLQSQQQQITQDQSVLIKNLTNGEIFQHSLNKQSYLISNGHQNGNISSDNNNHNNNNQHTLNHINLQIFSHSTSAIPEDYKNNNFLALRPESTEARSGLKKALTSSSSSAICSGSSAQPDSPNSYFTHKEQKLKIHTNRHQSGSDDSSLTEEEIDQLINQIVSKMTLNKKRRHFLRSSTIFRKKVASIVAAQKAENQNNRSYNSHSNPLSLKSIEDSPVDQILENISLGLLCYEVDSKEIVFVNHHIKEMFFEQEEREVFASMMKLKNYMQQETTAAAAVPASTTSSQFTQQQQQQQQPLPQASRNFDMIPADLFTQDFRQVSTLQCIQNNLSQKEIQKPPLSNSLLSINNQLSPVEGEIVSKIQPIIMDSYGKKVLSFSQQSTLKQQLNELISLISNEGFSGSTINDVKIRFMASFKALPNNNIKKVGLLRTSPLIYGNNLNQSTSSNNKERILQITLTPLRQGMKSMVLFIVEDVTHFNQIKVLESLNKNKSFMLSQVSHEIRNPISCIIAMLEEIQTKSHEEEKELMSCVQAALQSSKMLLNLLNDLLDMSQIKAGKFKLVLEQFDFLDLLKEVKDMMQPLARNKNNVIVLSVKEERNWVLVSDRYRIRQILINLISNSIKYTSKGQIFLGISVEPNDERLLRVSVRDEGVGIKKEFRQNLFQAFGMGDDMESKKKHNPHGVGLGLLISNTIAKNLKPFNLSNQNSMQNGIINNNPSSFATIKSALNPSIVTKGIKYSGNNISSGASIYNPDEGLILNEELERGSEFFFRVFNYQPISNSDQQPQQQQQQLGQLKNRHGSLNPHRIRGDSVLANQQKDLLFLSIPFQPRRRSAAETLTLETKERTSILDTHQLCHQEIFTVKDNPKFLSTDHINSEDESDSDSNSSGSYEKNPTGFHSTSPVGGGKSKSNYKHGAQNALEDIIRQHVVRRNLDSQFLDMEVKIMVVDDDQFSALALRSKITAAFRTYNRNLSVSFTTLYSGLECLTELKKRAVSYSFLFIDSQMPELDGFETIQLIDEGKLRENPKPLTGFKEIMIILCSGMPKEETKLFIHHIPYFLQKPIEQEGLMQIIQQSFQENAVEMR